MATQAYHVTSVYEAPKEDEIDSEEQAAEAAWRSGRNLNRSQIPTFVKPSGLYDESGRLIQPPIDDEIQIISHTPAAIGKWYKQLSREGGAPSTSASPLLGVSSIPKNENLAEVAQVEPPTRKLEDSRRLNTSIGEMLTRNPPPLPSEPRIEAPIWTALGPSNRGYALLQQRGWQEGRGLGITELQRPKVQPRQTSQSEDVVDLTVDSGSESDPTYDDVGTDAQAGSNDRRVLLTPLPTVLRSNRTGLGSSRGAKRTIGNTADAVRFVEDTRRQRKREQWQESNGGAKAARRKAKIESRQRSQLLSELKST